MCIRDRFYTCKRKTLILGPNERGVRMAMARKKSGISQVRGFLYGLAKLLGDISALSKGPKATGKRIGYRARGQGHSQKLPG